MIGDKSPVSLQMKCQGGVTKVRVIPNERNCAEGHSKDGPQVSILCESLLAARFFAVLRRKNERWPDGLVGFQ